MQPGHALFAALDKDIWDRIADRLYTFPILSGRPTKKSPLQHFVQSAEMLSKSLNQHLEIAKGLRNI